MGLISLTVFTSTLLLFDNFTGSGDRDSEQSVGTPFTGKEIKSL